MTKFHTWQWLIIYIYAFRMANFTLKDANRRPVCLRKKKLSNTGQQFSFKTAHEYFLGEKYCINITAEQEKHGRGTFFPFFFFQTKLF